MYKRYRYGAGPPTNDLLASAWAVTLHAAGVPLLRPELLVVLKARYVVHLRTAGQAGMATPGRHYRRCGDGRELDIPHRHSENAVAAAGVSPPCSACCTPTVCLCRNCIDMAATTPFQGEMQKQASSNGAFRTAAAIIRQEGISGLYAGVSPAVARHIPYSGAHDVKQSSVCILNAVPEAPAVSFPLSWRLT